VTKHRSSTLSIVVVILVGYGSNVASFDKCQWAAEVSLASRFQDCSRVFWNGGKRVDPRRLFGKDTLVLRKNDGAKPVKDEPAIQVHEAKGWFPYCITVKYEWATDPLRGGEGTYWYVSVFGVMLSHGERLGAAY
jgi:hypothetical protein